MAVLIQMRHGSAASATANNPLLMVGEIGVETDTKKMKIGDGVTYWNSLGYAALGTVLGMNAPANMTASGTGTATLTLTWSGSGANLVCADGTTIPVSTYVLASAVGVASGVAGLDGSGKVPFSQLPASLSGAVHYVGTWNAATNTPTLPAASTAAGSYYIVSVAGTYSGTYYNVGDNVISDGTNWDKIDNNNAVTSVFGRTGTVVAASGDYAAFYAPIASPSFTGTMKIGSLAGTLIGTGGVVSALSGTNLVLGNGSTIAQSTFALASALSSYAPLASPSFTGTVTLPTGLSGSLIATAGVVSALSGTNLVLGNGSTIPQSTFATTSAIPVGSTTTPLMDGTATIGSSGKWADGAHVHPTDTSRQAYFAILNTLGGLPNNSGALTNNGTGVLSWAAYGTVTTLVAPSLMTASGAGTATITLAWNGSSANLVRADGSTVAASTYALSASPTISGSATFTGQIDAAELIMTALTTPGVLKNSAIGVVTSTATTSAYFVLGDGSVVATSTYATASYVAGTYAPLASPTFTGTVTLPTGLSGTLIATAGVVSALTGANLVLASGSTIAQSTFQTANANLTTVAGYASVTNLTSLTGLSNPASTAHLQITSGGLMSWDTSVYALASSVPVVTTTTPNMDGTATIGGTGKWADGGHIHPTDTSRQAASGILTTLAGLTNATGVLSNNGAGTLSWATAATGTVTAITAPALMTAGGSGTATLTLAWNGSSANLVRADGSTVAQATFLTTAPTITLTGDVTGTGTGSFATTIAASAVTLAKMANLAAHSVIGNLTGSAAAPVAVPANTVAAANTIPVLDGNVNLDLNTWAPNTQNIATAAGATNLTVTSPYQTIFTGSTTQTVILPPANTGLAVGTKYEIDNNSTGAVTVQTNGGGAYWILAAGTCLLVSLTDITTAAGIWDNDYLGAVISSGKAVTAVDNLKFPTNTPGVPWNDGAGNIAFYAGINAFGPVEAFGHSYLDNAYEVGQATPSSTGLYIANNDAEFASMFCAVTNIERSRFRNHGVISSQLLLPGRSAGGFAKVLTELKKPKQYAPFLRYGPTYLFDYGINDIGNTTVANQTLMRSNFTNCLMYCISRARASAVYLAGAGGAWTKGSNFSVVTTTVADYTSGNAISAAAVDSSGTSTATFTIPAGYKGEPICFGLIGTSGSSGIVTWGGTIAGTSGILATTTTLSSTTVQAQGIIAVRFTAAANGLSAANAGQTITIKVSTYTSGTIVIDGCHIESFKPPAVLVGNVPRIACRNITVASGDGVTTGVNTAFTSATINFNSTSDAGGSIVETDAQGGIGAGLTISSVSSATTIVLSGNATAAKTNIQFTIQRVINGYKGNYSTNTDFSGATPASHSAADTDVTSLNTAVATMITNTFDSMVQIADRDSVLGTDPAPSQVVSYFGGDGLHFNEAGQPLNVRAWITAMGKVAIASATDSIGLGPFQSTASAAISPSSLDLMTYSSGVYLPTGAQVQSTSYTAVAGDVFAYPIKITATTEYWTNWLVEQTNAPATAGSNVRIGWYDDVNNVGYPQCLRQEITSGGAFALGTASGMKTIGAANQSMRCGQWIWLVIKIDSLGTTASQLRAVIGPVVGLPNWLAAGGQVAPAAWKLTGVGAGALPTIFTAGATLVGTAPALAVTKTVQ